MGPKMGWRVGRRGRGGSAGESGCVVRTSRIESSPPSPSRLSRTASLRPRLRHPCTVADDVGGDLERPCYPPASASALRTPASALARLAPPVLPSPLRHLQHLLSHSRAAPRPAPRSDRPCVGAGPTSRPIAKSSSGSSTAFPFRSAPPLTTPTAASAPTATWLAAARRAHLCCASRFLH
jgi:hypothetical protein